MRAAIVLFVRAGLAAATAFVWLPILSEGLSFGAPYWPPPGLIGAAVGHIVFATLTVAVPALLWALPGVSRLRLLANSVAALVAVPVVLAWTDIGAGLEVLAFVFAWFSVPGAIGLALAYGAWVGVRALVRRRTAR